MDSCEQFIDPNWMTIISSVHSLSGGLGLCSAILTLWPSSELNKKISNVLVEKGCDIVWPEVSQLVTMSMVSQLKMAFGSSPSNLHVILSQSKKGVAQPCARKTLMRRLGGTGGDSGKDWKLMHEELVSRDIKNGGDGGVLPLTYSSKIDYIIDYSHLKLLPESSDQDGT